MTDDFVMVRGDKHYVYKNELDLSALGDKKITEIAEIEGLSQLTYLRKLNLYDNRLKEITGLDTLINLRILNLGWNKIEEIKGLENLTNLEELILFHNRIEEIQGLESLTNLQRLNLDGNQIKEISDLEAHTNLKLLVLNLNQIEELKDLEHLTKLEELEIWSNQIEELKGLENLTRLQKLDLSENQIKELKGLENLKNLKSLNLGGNQITEIKGLEQLRKLQELNLTDNHIKEVKGLEHLVSLQKLYLEGNPIKDDEEELVRMGWTEAQTLMGYCQEKAGMIAKGHFTDALKLNIPAIYYSRFKNLLGITGNWDATAERKIPTITPERLLLDQAHISAMGTKENVYNFLFKRGIATNLKDFEEFEPPDTKDEVVTNGKNLFYNLDGVIFWKIYDGVFERNARIYINKDIKKPSFIESTEHNVAIVIAPRIENDSPTK